MSSIIDNVSRIGNFTNSEIYKLIPYGTTPMSEDEIVEFRKANPKSKKTTKQSPFSSLGLTYIQEKNIERRMGLSLGSDVYSKPIAWGEIIEMYVHQEILGLEYESVGKTTLSHPTIPYWKGSPDNVDQINRVVGDTKGYQRKAYAEYADTIMLESVDALRENHPQEYWQLTGNAILLGYDKIQPILFMPYKSELEKIREFADNYDGEDQWKYQYISLANDNQLPYLQDNGYYPNLVTHIYDIPKQDKELLTSKVLLGGDYLEPFHTIKS